MPTMMRHAARAYQAAADNRSQREQEADVFRRATGALRAARGGRALDRARAVADNRQLWLTVIGLVRNRAMHCRRQSAPPSFRCRSVQNEMDCASPDIEFLIAVNENVAAGLSGDA